MVADPVQANVIYIGGDRQPATSWNTNTQSGGLQAARNSVGLGAWLARIFRGDTSSATGSQWVQVVGTGANGTAPHGDSRAMAFQGTNLIEVDDGGINRLVNPSNLPFIQRRWESLTPVGSANGLQTSELYSIAFDSAGRLIGGTQDTGSSFQATATGTNWTTLSQGDGMFVAVDRSGPSTTYYYTNQNLGSFKAWTDTNGNGIQDASDTITSLNVNDSAGNRLGGGNFPFVTPYVLNSQPRGARSAQQMLLGGPGLWELTGLPPVGPALAATRLFINGSFGALAYGGVNKTDGLPQRNIIYAYESVSKKLYIRDALGNGVFYANPTAGRIVAIKLDPRDWMTSYLVVDMLGNNNDRIYKLTVTPKNPTGLNLAVENITGDLRDTHLDAIEVVTGPGAPIGNRVLLVGGHGGVYRSIDPTKTTAKWHEFGVGLPNAPVTDLEYNSASGTLYAGTWGRGAWSINTNGLLYSILFNQTILEITGTAGDDLWSLSLDATDRSKLFISEQLGTTGAKRTFTFQLSAFDKIVVKGGAGDDSIIVDAANGLITGVIEVEGEGQAGQDHLLLLGPTKSVFPKNPAVDDKASLKGRDYFGQLGSQIVNWKGIEDAKDLGAAKSALQTTAVGLLLTGKGKWSESSLHKAFPGLGSSLIKFANSARPSRSRGVVDFGAPVTLDRELELGVDLGTPFLIRLIESGLNGFSLDEIGEEQDINSLEALRSALDGLDTTAGNVTLTDLNGVTTFQLQILTTLSGPADLDVLGNALGGLLDLKGELEISADVAVNLTFGVDDTDFFITPNSTSPEIVISNLRVTGEVTGMGQIGFLGVTVSGATLTIDPAVKIILKLQDPGTDAADGMIRLEELEEGFEQVASTTLQGNPNAADVTLSLKISVAAIGDSGQPLFDIGDAAIKLTWDDVNTPEQFAFAVTAGPSEELLNFLQKSADSFLDGLSSVAAQFQQMTGIGVFSVNIPLVNKNLGQIMSDVAESGDDRQQLCRLGLIAVQRRFQ